MKTIDAKETKELLANEKIMLIDVRESDEFKSEHIEGAINIPASTLNPEALNKLIDSKACVIQCLSGKRAEKVHKQLNSSSQNQSCILEGGISSWKKSGFKTICKNSTLSLFRQIQIVAGMFIFLGSLASLTISSKFIFIPLFFGIGLLFAGISGWCGLGMLLQKMPWNKP